MNKLDKIQYNFLKKIYKVDSLKYSELSNQEKDICHFLKDNGYVDYDKITSCDDSSELPLFYEDILNVKINEKGKSYCYSLHEDKFRFTIPNIINAILAIIAIIISIFALLKP